MAPPLQNNMSLLEKIRQKKSLSLLMIILIAGCVLGIAGLSIGFSLLSTRPDQTKVDVEVIAPAIVEAGQDFQLVVRYNNRDDMKVTLSEIRLPRNILQSGVLTGIDPAPVSQVEYDEWIGYSFGKFEIAPAQSGQISFLFKALSPGDFSGSLQIVMGGIRKVSNIRVVVSAVQPVVVQNTPIPTPVETVILLAPAPTAVSIPYAGVVHISAMAEINGSLQEAWWGSGTIISTDGLIVTNAHVAASTKEMQVKDLIISLTIAPDVPPEKKYIARVVQLDQNLDIAILQIEADLNHTPIDPSSLKLTAVPLGDSDHVQLNDDLVILGYPGIGGSTITLTSGKVGGFTAEEGYGNRAFIKTSATVAGGNSGGLAANSKGEIIGIPTQLGYGGNDQYADCRRLVDTNQDGQVNSSDICVPTGGFINALRPIRLAIPLIEAARGGVENLTPAVNHQERWLPDGKQIINDDFSNVDSGWFRGADETGSSDYRDGEYWFEIKPANRLIWVKLDQSFPNVDVLIDATIQKSAGSGSYGILCRYEDENNFYGLGVSEDGYFSIWKRQAGEYLFLNYWQFSSLIPSGQKIKITATCKDDLLALAVDDKLLARVNDSSFQSGKIGLFVQTYAQGGITVSFDNFSVYTP